MPGLPATEGTTVLLTPGAAGAPDSGVIKSVQQKTLKIDGYYVATAGDICEMTNSVTGAKYPFPIPAPAPGGVAVDGKPLVRIGDTIVAPGITLTIVAPAPDKPLVSVLDNWPVAPR